jgi:hypothetical protein
VPKSKKTDVTFNGIARAFHVQKIQNSNFGQKTRYPECFCCFSQSFSKNFGIVSQILTTASFDLLPVDFLLIVLPFYSAQSEAIRVLQEICEISRSGTRVLDVSVLDGLSSNRAPCLRRRATQSKFVIVYAIKAYGGNEL